MMKTIEVNAHLQSLIDKWRQVLKDLEANCVGIEYANAYELAKIDERAADLRENLENIGQDIVACIVDD